MRAGHVYLVSVNRDNGNPLVVRVIHEIDEPKKAEPQAPEGKLDGNG